MRLALFIMALCFLVGCEDEKPLTTTCVHCLEDDIKIGAKKCKHCGSDPYGRGMEAETKREMDLDNANWINKDKNRHWQWPWQRPYWFIKCCYGLILFYGWHRFWDVLGTWENLSDEEKEFVKGIGGRRMYICLMILMTAVGYWFY